MTGTGIQSDPYVVSTLEDLITAAGTAGAYVKLGANIDVGLDQTYREGLSSPLAFSCAECDLDGKYIKNFIVTATSAISIAAGTSVKNGKILNFVHKSTAAGAAIIAGTGATITHVDLSCVQHGYGYTCTIVSGGTYDHCSLHATSKTHTIVSNEDGTHPVLNPGSMSSSSIYIDALAPAINSNSYTRASFLALNKCSVVGKLRIVAHVNQLGWSALGNCRNSYCALEISSPQNRTVMCYNLAGINFIVTDISQGSAGTLTYSTSSAFLGLTSAQARDASYLYGIGFLP